MGIKNLNQFLKTNASSAFIDLPITYFSNSSIAIDTSIVLYKLMSKAIKIVANQTNLNIHKLCRYKVIRVLLTLTSNFVQYWLKYNIKPIFIFDGTSSNEKLRILTKRYNQKQNKKLKIEKMYNSNQKNIYALKKELSNHIEFTLDEKLMYKKYIKSLRKVTCIDAPGEGEKLCSMLCHEGYVKGAYTLDTDAFAYGCPLIIQSYNKPILKCVKMDQVLHTLKFTQSMFIDFAIICGCDYNTSSSYFKITNQEIYQLLNIYHCIEQLPFIFDKVKLNYIYCRNEFKFMSCSQLISPDLLKKL